MQAKGLAKLGASAQLLLASVIWGTTFVAQSVAMDFISPFTFLAFRSGSGALVLLPVIFIFDAKNRSQNSSLLFGSCVGAKRKNLFIGGLAVGTVLFVATALQQFGLQTTTVANAGFITTLYIVIVPIVSIVLRRVKFNFLIVISVVLSLAGLYFMTLSGKQNSGINIGDILMLGCAVVYSGHILLVDVFTDKTDALRLSCMQLGVCSVFSIIAMFIFEQPNVVNILKCWLPILYAGVLSSGVAFTLQIVAQKKLNAPSASLIMSLEGVFALLGGVIILTEFPSTRELVGCALAFVAVIIVQLMPAKNVQS